MNFEVYSMYYVDKILCKHCYVDNMSAKTTEALFSAIKKENKFLIWCYSVFFGQKFFNSSPFICSHLKLKKEKSILLCIYSTWSRILASSFYCERNWRPLRIKINFKFIFLYLTFSQHFFLQNYTFNFALII